MSNPNVESDSKSCCADCKQLRVEVCDFRNFVSYLFDVFSRRFDDQDRNLAFIVQSVGDGVVPPISLPISETTSHRSVASREIEKTTAEFIGNVTTSSNHRDDDEERIEPREKFVVPAVEVEEDETETDVKPDINLLRQSLLKPADNDTNKLEYFSPSLGLKSDSSPSKPPILVAQEKGAKDAKLATSGNYCASIQQQIKTIEEQMKKKQFIVVRDKANTSGKMTVMKGALNNCLKAALIVNGVPSTPAPVARATVVETEPKSTGIEHQPMAPPLPSTILGNLYRRPLSEEAKKRLMMSRPKAERVANLVTVPEDSPGPVFRPPSEEAKRRLLQMALQRSGTGEMLNAKKRLSMTMRLPKAKRKKHASSSESVEESEGESSSLNEEEDEEEEDDSLQTIKESVEKNEFETNPLNRCCPICGKEFRTVRNMLRHKELHNLTKSKHKCESCEKVYPTKESLNRHVKAKHDDVNNVVPVGVLKCKHCDECFFEKKKLSDHLTSHYREGDRFKCKLCDNSYNWYNNLTRHIKRAHNGQDV